ncbi:MAG: Ig domain-containing protein [Paludibacteraceae bacterium]
MNKLKLFGLAIATLFTGSAIAADYTSLNYNGEATVPTGYKYYGSSSGKEDPSIFVTLSYEGHTVFDVTGGGTGAYNKRAMEFTLTEDCTVDFELYTGNTNRKFQIYQGSTLLTETSLTTTKTLYTFSYEFKGATTAQPITYSFTGSGSKVYAAKITFTSAAPITTPIVKVYNIAGINATIDETAKTITAELPYGTDKEAALNAAVVTLGGTATSYSYNADKTELTVTDGTNNVTYTLNITIGAFKCGEIINAILTSGTTATVTGTIGGTASVSLSSSKKLDNGKYFGITLTSGTFMEGDVVNINVTTAAGQGFVAIYADKEMTTPLYVAEDWGVAGDNEFVLSKEATGHTSLWIARKDDINKWNPVLNFISVTRACDNSIVGFTLAGAEAVIDNEAKTITIELPFGTELTDEDWNKAYTAAGPDAANVTYGENHATLTVGDITYTLNVTIATAPSSDATLKSITVNGTAITLEEGKTAYTFALPYKTTELPIVAAEANDANATVAISEITATEQTVTITVTAQDQSKQEYTIAISVQTAPKEFQQIIMSNGYSAWSPEGYDNIYAYYLAGTEKPSIIAEEVVLCSTATAYALSEDGATLTVTGEDATTKDYPFVCEAVAPATTLNETITFDGSESWIKGGYGYDATKGWKFSKTDTDYSREWNGKTHIEMFLPACDAVILTGSDVSARNIKVYINGTEFGSFTTVKNGDLTLDVKQSAPFMLTIASAQTGGDGGFSAAKLVKNETVVPTAIALDQEAANMTVGQTLTLTVITTPEGASLEGLTWSSSDETMATVADGVVTAVGSTGYDVVTITATLGELTATCDIIIKPAIESIAFTEEMDYVMLFEEYLSISLDEILLVNPYGADKNQIEYTSSNEQVASIEKSQWSASITFLSAGEVTITATVPGTELKAEVTFTILPAETQVTLDQTTLTLLLNNTATLVATVTPATTAPIQWWSEDETIATVDNTGKVTPVAVGTTTIHAQVVYGVEATCQVTVTDNSTGLENIAELDTNAPIYNVLGQEVSAEYKGVVIQNGKKFLLQ